MTVSQTKPNLATYYTYGCWEISENVTNIVADRIGALGCTKAPRGLLFAGRLDRRDVG